MTEEEKSYITNLSSQIPGFLDYYFIHKNESDLNNLLCEYSDVLSSIGMLTPHIEFLIGAVQRIYLKSLERTEDILRIVNRHKRINDIEIVREFAEESTDIIIGLERDSDDIDHFLRKYLDSYNPYICSRIALPFIKSNRYDEGLTFLQQAANYTFMSPNIFWHNPEAIEGCAQVIDSILGLIGDAGLKELNCKNPYTSKILLEYTYLLLSRVIYWEDQFVAPRLTSYELPIKNIHKTGAHSRRAKLLETYKDYWHNNPLTTCYDLNAIIIYDYNMAHKYAYDNWDVGENSTYLNEANKYLQLYSHLCKEEIISIGEQSGRKFAYCLYKEYAIGKYALSREDIAKYFFFIKSKVKNIDDITIFGHLLRNAKKIYSDKPDKEQIRTWLNDNGITEFYHFTPIENIRNIIENGGLYSYRQCLDKGIKVSKTKDTAQLRDLDASYDLDDYVRLSFCEYHPLIQERKLQGANLVRLKVKIDVAWFEGTLFSDRDAVDPNHSCGHTFDDLLKVDLFATSKCDLRKSDPNYSKNQAEVMVRSCIPVSYITNLNNPDFL